MATVAFRWMKYKKCFKKSRSFSIRSSLATVNMSLIFDKLRMTELKILPRRTRRHGTIRRLCIRLFRFRRRLGRDIQRSLSLIIETHAAQ